VNHWNEAYHESDACSQFREADLKLTVLAAALKGGNVELDKSMEATASISAMYNSAMKDLFYLAKKTFAPLPEPQKGVYKKANIQENYEKKAETYISLRTGEEV